ncbi:hypothetical protein E2C01_099161 [Portunus trituberculatus]|uniref:Uncharacterized protein n=1 Tax=Portunus trituberculatus TaxID=210409 RepID=A0A5B7K8V8_PORTR|nr:hypothetical protein [Portunus trituberculatus]
MNNNEEIKILSMLYSIKALHLRFYTQPSSALFSVSPFTTTITATETTNTTTTMHHTTSRSRSSTRRLHNSRVESLRSACETIIIKTPSAGALTHSALVHILYLLVFRFFFYIHIRLVVFSSLAILYL